METLINNAKTLKLRAIIAYEIVGHENELGLFSLVGGDWPKVLELENSDGEKIIVKSNDSDMKKNILEINTFGHEYEIVKAAYGVIEKLKIDV